MKRKILWLIVSSLMVLSLVMASCAPAVVEKEKEEVVKEEVEKEEVGKEVVAPTVEKPKYGGVLRPDPGLEPSGFEPLKDSKFQLLSLTHDRLFDGDWTKGPAGGYGTNETSWSGRLGIRELCTGYLAESWEFPTKVEGETSTIIWHIRRGIHFALNPQSEASRLVGGREMTVDDVLFSLNKQITEPWAYVAVVCPELKATKISSPAPWTVKMEFPAEYYEDMFESFIGKSHIVPREVYEKWGSTAMADWRKSVGTGSFMLTDVVPGSSFTCVRNSNYWMKDPIGPGKGNQLPYLDGVKTLMIPDKSTQFAALRTGKIDLLGDVFLEDAKLLKKTSPQLVLAEMAFRGGGGGGDYSHIGFKLDQPPFNDIRVRRALMMAIDFEGIKRHLYGDVGQIVTFPITYMKEYADAYYGPDPTTGAWPSDCPESVKELYSYNPEKAKTLLAEAGYPAGFKTNLILRSTVMVIDYYSIIKDYWSKVGVDMELRPKEKGAFTTIRYDKTFDAMISAMGGQTSDLYYLKYYYGTGRSNISSIDDPMLGEFKTKMRDLLFSDSAAANRVHNELMKYVLDQVWAIPMVYGPMYMCWQPWLKNYSGELYLGPSEASYSPFSFIWLDEEVKKSMGYK